MSLLQDLCFVPSEGVFVVRRLISVRLSRSFHSTLGLLSLLTGVLLSVNFFFLFKERTSTFPF